MRRTLAAPALAAALILTAACQSTADSSSGGGGGTSGGGGSSSGGASGGDTGAPPPVTPAGSDNTCFSRFFPPPSGIVPGASVKGTVQTFCTVPPRRHNMTIELQRFFSKSWSTQNTKEVDIIPTSDIRFNLITAPCVPGPWRLHVRINVESATGVTQVVDETSPEQEVKPSDCG